MKVLRAVAAALGIAMVGDVHAEARTWYVNATGSGDAPTIRAAIDSADGGDTILVAAGTYSWTTQGGDTLGQRYTGPSLIRMALRQGITLRSESGPAATILDAEGQGRVFFLYAVADVRIEGFTIRGGRAENPYGYPDWRGIGHGGGIFTRSSLGVTIMDNIIVDNYAVYLGAGIGMGDTDGGAVLSNVIARNHAGYGRSGGIEVGGAASNVEIRGSTIVENRGTGISCVATGSLTISHNILASNGYNSINNAGGYGIYCIDTQPVVSCNDVWGNAVSNSICGSDAGGNFSADPHLCVTSAEYELRPDSPCLPDNNPCNVLIGARGIGCAVTDSESEPRGDVAMLSISPNPARGRFIITYGLPHDTRSARVTVFDLRGRIVAQIPADAHAASRTVPWDSRDKSGAPVSAGVYFVRLQTDRDAVVEKLVITR